MGYGISAFRDLRRGDVNFHLWCVCGLLRGAIERMSRGPTISSWSLAFEHRLWAQNGYGADKLISRSGEPN